MNLLLFRTVRCSQYGSVYADHHPHRAAWHYPTAPVLIETVAKGDSEDPHLTPRYNQAIRDDVILE